MRARLAVAAATGLLIAFAPTAAADTAIVIGGNGNGTPTDWQMDHLLGGMLDETYTREPISYPASAWPMSGGTYTLNQSIAAASPLMLEAIKTAEDKTVVIGASQGTLVLADVQTRLEDDPDAPDEVTFIYIAPLTHRSPQTTSLLWHLPDGLYIPGLDWTVRRVPTESSYNTIVVVGEYDGVADFPDRPWNLVAVANAAVGWMYTDNVHASSVNADLSQVPERNVTVTVNSKGATTTTYLVPTRVLPLTRPLRDMGVPKHVVDGLDAWLRPMVDAGYHRNDPKPPAPPAAPEVTEEPQPEPEPTPDPEPAPEPDPQPQREPKPEPEPEPVNERRNEKPKVRESFKAVPGDVDNTVNGQGDDTKPVEDEPEAETEVEPAAEPETKAQPETSPEAAEDEDQADGDEA